MTDPDHRLSTLAPASRRPEAVDRWRRRSARVAVARKLLPAGIVLIVGVMGGWTALAALKSTIKAPNINAAEIKMDNPHFYGRDDKNRAFQISAAQAMRSEADPDLVRLTAPMFSLESSRVTAREGVYRQGSNRVDLSGSVHFTDGEGGQLATEQAVINTKTGVLTNGANSRGIEISTATGHVQSDQYTVGKNGEVTLKGNVHGVLQLKKKK